MPFSLLRLNNAEGSAFITGTSTITNFIDIVILAISAASSFIAELHASCAH